MNRTTQQSDMSTNPQPPTMSKKPSPTAQERQRAKDNAKRNKQLPNKPVRHDLVEVRTDAKTVYYVAPERLDAWKAQRGICI